MSTPIDNPWSGKYKIPWDEPGFSQRMLDEHLSQRHDLASRRTEWIDRQAAWIHQRLLNETPSRILDLGCGPGLYAHRLARLGHEVRGIDFGPASIDYARRHIPEGASCEFAQADIRHGDFGGPFDLVLLLYGEMNVFAPPEIAGILARARASLAPSGRLVVEAHRPEAVEEMGRGEPSEYSAESGLFSDSPHHCRTESRWLPGHQVAIQTFTVTETETGRVQTYRSTTKSWPDGALAELFVKAGFSPPAPYDDWPGNSEVLRVWVAARA